MNQAKQKGSIFGATLLITGCCIGAGMLGMPVVTREAGFSPSVLVFLFSWLFMTTSALVLLEVALWFPSETNMAEMAKKYLGRSGEWITFSLMIFLMYALMTAYSSGSGQLLSDFTQGAISPRTGSLSFALVLLVALGIGTRALDFLNRFFVLFLALSYLALVYFGLPEISFTNLKHANFSLAIDSLPLIIIAFGFQNIVPSLVRYLDRDAKKIRTSIILGSLIPLVIYLLWEMIILGLIPQDFEGLDEAQIATSLIRIAAGGHEVVILLAEAFAFFAITTSFIGNALSIRDFLSDQWGGAKSQKRLFLFALAAVVPPVIFAFIYPDIFISALVVAGGFSAIVLFGLIPAVICIQGRRKEMNHEGTVPGGSLVLWILVAISLGLLLIPGS